MKEEIKTKKICIFKEILGSILSSNSNYGYYSCGSYTKNKDKAFDFGTKSFANRRLKQMIATYGNEFTKFKIVIL